MLVDPELLRAFAGQVDQASSALRDVNVDGAASSAADGLPGSETQWATRQVGDHLYLSAKDVIDDVAAMGIAVRGAGDRYEVEDGALADGFKKLF
ncbi:hypothetical protein [Mycolicibacterium sp. 050158]|jgi:hypothetical protein|uniref:hypothetical protein n=1 Tax=Mycolicibacterium sp. 050158 TaxID=3090602 RepID=UPI00299E5821|nr:hypothetical protein [Mycolicibacterium sp. 050158]MDX1890067.1 hypothetical protein [Mycolicibacterium sp. 050158]